MQAQLGKPGCSSVPVQGWIQAGEHGKGAGGSHPLDWQHERQHPLVWRPHASTRAPVPVTALSYTLNPNP